MTDPDADNLRAPEPQALDPRQVARISAAHGGFLYQHLYVAACLLTVGRARGVQIVVERDEDVEIVRADGRQYIQIKTRNRQMQPADIAEALDRFEALRREHESGARPGTARFAIVANTEPGPRLAAQLGGADWPADVTSITPGRPPQEDTSLPPAWPDYDAAVAWCAAAAAEVPFGALPPQTLVWKLAALAMHAAAGARDRSFRSEAMPELLEQLVLQLQHFPEPPATYRPQENEPPLVTDARVRLIVGFSGAGKTAWASQAAVHAPDAVAYFDVGDMPAASVANALARELAARFIGSAAGGGAMLAASGGLGVLRACAAMLRRRGVSATVVLDNAHRVAADDLRRLVDAADGVRFVCLAQPWDASAEAEARFAVGVEALAGWSLEAIAAEFRSEGAPLTLEAAARVRGLTGGLPLFVASAARIVREAYDGDAAAFCDAIERRVHDADTAQDLILCDAVAQLGPSARRAIAALSLAETPLSREEVRGLLAAVELSEVEGAAALREMRRRGIVTAYQGERLSLHDALRPLAGELRAELGEARVLAARERLYALLMVSLRQSRDVPRLSAILRLLPLIGQAEALAELASDEMFYEQGDPRTLRQEIERVADDPSRPPFDRFWADDALAYWEGRDGGVPRLDRLERMAEVVRSAGLGEREQLALAFKQLLYFASAGDRDALDRIYRQAGDIARTPQGLRLLTYNYAVALWRTGAWREVAQIADSLIGDYLRLFGLNERQLFRAFGQALRTLFGPEPDLTEVKRLADCLALWSTARVELGLPPLLRRIYATKVYAVAQAARSAVMSGLEAVDDFLQLHGDPVGALEVMEQLVLPGLREAQLTDLVVLARSHYAIVLAWLGRLGEARSEMAALQQFTGGAEQTEMLRERSQAVEDIARSRLRLAPRPAPAGAPAELLATLGPFRPRAPKVRRNAPCPCGSGRKFKHCHGRAT